MRNYSACLRLQRKYFFLFIFLGYGLSSFAQDVMLQGWFWNYPASIGVKRWGQNYLSYVPDLQQAGFTYMWLPPLSRAAASRGMGYDIKDYYDLGEYGLGATRFGTRRDVNNLVAALQAAGISPVADMVYNQRTGGDWEANPAVKGWIENMNSTKLNNGDNPYPSDRFRCAIPVGGSSGNGPGTYYVQIRSVSQDARFYGNPYTFQAFTTKTPIRVDSLFDSYEYEPNNGGGCGDTSNFYNLGARKWANIDNGGCGVDEFRVTIDTSMYNTTGDTLVFTMMNSNTSGLSGFSDHGIQDIYSAPLSKSIKDQVIYQTETNFTHVASGKGFMDWRNFKPNGNPTSLNGDWDLMLFFYDIDQAVQSTTKTYSDYQDWMFDSIGIRGMRVDAVKNMSTDFAAKMMDSLHLHGHSSDMVVGEYYDGNPGALVNYINTVEGKIVNGNPIKMKLFDFALRFPLQNACNLNIDVRDVFNVGIVNGGGGKKENSVTWINNHDFRDPGTYVDNNPELAYAYIITNQLIGTPCVYHTDYFANNTLRGKIKGLMKAGKKYTFDADKVNYLNRYNSPYASYITSGYTENALIFQFHNPVTNRVAIMAINFSQSSFVAYQQIDTTNVAIGDTFTDIFNVGLETTTTITANRELRITLPPRSFTMFVQGDLRDSLLTFGDTITQSVPNAIEDFEEVNTGNINVYPNPFNNRIHLQVEELQSENLLVTLYDLSGRQLYTTKLYNPVNGVVSFDPELQTAGLYLLKISANNENRFYKLIKN